MSTAVFHMASDTDTKVAHIAMDVKCHASRFQHKFIYYLWLQLAKTEGKHSQEVRLGTPRSNVNAASYNRRCKWKFVRKNSHIIIHVMMPHTCTFMATPVLDFWLPYLSICSRWQERLVNFRRRFSYSDYAPDKFEIVRGASGYSTRTIIVTRAKSCFPASISGR